MTETIYVNDLNDMIVHDHLIKDTIEILQDVNNFTIETYTDFKRYVRDFMVNFESKKIEYNKLYASIKNLEKPIPYKLTDTDCTLIIMRFLTIRKIALSGDLKAPTETTFVYDFNPTSKTYGSYIDMYDRVGELLFLLKGSNDTASSRKNIMEQLSVLAPTVTESIDQYHIPVENGIYNKRTKQLEPFSKDFVTISKIDTPYTKNSTCPILYEPNGDPWLFDNWMRELADNDDDKEKLLWQVFSAAFNPGKAYNKAVLFYSEEGNNGKGTFGQIIKNIVGVGNYSSLKIADYEKRFYKIQLVGKVVNIADENPVGSYIDASDTFKAAVTGDDIICEPKHKNAYPLQIKHLTIQMLNGLPKVRDKSNSFYRRLVIVTFNHTFEGREKKYIKSEFITNPQLLTYILSKSLDMDPFDEFVTPQTAIDALASYKSENNSVFDFWDEMSSQFQWDFLPFKFTYFVYKGWMAEYNSNSMPMDSKAFKRYSKSWMDTSSEWIYKADRTHNVRVLTKMDADEPLVTYYNIRDYMNPTYVGNDPKKIRKIDFSDKTLRGFLRNK